MSDTKFWTYLRSTLRRAFLRYPIRQQCIRLNRKPYEGENKRQKWSCTCEICGIYLKMTEVHVDHIEPIGQLKQFSDLQKFTETLFCEQDNLRILCKPCHKVITKEQRKKR